MFSLDRLPSDRSDYNASDVAVIEAPERRRQHGKSNK